MRIVFAGTPEFAVVMLRALVERGVQLAGVYTQPDRPAGRGRRPRASPVKMLAEEYGLRVCQPSTLRSENAAGELLELQPDLMVVAAYGLILPHRCWLPRASAASTYMHHCFRAGVVRHRFNAPCSPATVSPGSPLCGWMPGWTLARSCVRRVA